MNHAKLQGLVAAVHTPFDSSGDLHLDVVEKQAEHLARSGVNAAFVGGTTGESHSLTVAERLALAQRWSEVVGGVGGSQLKLIVHVGSNCLADAKTMAAQAQKLGALAISAVAPSYFKPASLDILIDCCREVTSAAPAVPFYYYHIPPMTGLQFSMPDFLQSAPARIPTLVGIKFSSTDLLAYQRCLRADNGRFDMPWGVDECLLSALAAGAIGAVGSSYNFAAPIYQRIIAAFAKGDLAAARVEQHRSVQLIDLLGTFGYMAASKAMMELMGIPVGSPRLPNARLDSSQRTRLKENLERLGFLPALV